MALSRLPDIDFNIRAGNTLVGYATLHEMKKALDSKLDFDNAAEKIAVRAADLQQAFDAFRSRQIEGDGSVPAEDKQELRWRLKALDDELNLHLATDYGVEPSKKDAFAKWLKSHQPFHWFVEFYGIVHGQGGFDVVIGNPPFVEYSHKSFAYRINDRLFRTFPARNLYAFVFERSKRLTRSGGRVGLIVQISAVSTPSMETMVGEIKREVAATWISNYATRPSCLFDGVTMNLTIVLSQTREGATPQQAAVFSTRYMRWSPEFRPFLFETLTPNAVQGAPLFPFAIPKLTMFHENDLLRKLAQQSHRVGDYLEPTKRGTGQELFYRTAGGRYFKIFSDRDFGSESKSNKVKSFRREVSKYVMIAVLSSNVWWWYYTLHFDMYNCKDYMMFGFPFSYSPLAKRDTIEGLSRQLVHDLFENAERKVQSYESTGQRVQLLFRPSASKPIIDQIDRALAGHYGFTEDELDFIINYDIKYRVGADTEGRDERVAGDARDHSRSEAGVAVHYSQDAPRARQVAEHRATPSVDRESQNTDPEDDQSEANPPKASDLSDKEDVITAVRRAFATGGDRERHVAIRDVLEQLGFHRVGSRIREEVDNAIRTAVRRGIVDNVDGLLCPGPRSVDECDRDLMKEQFLASLGGSQWTTREDAIRGFARWLGYRRTGSSIKGTAKSLINGLLREGLLEGDGGSIRKT